MKKIFIPLVLMGFLSASCGDKSNYTKVSNSLPRAVSAIPLNDGNTVASNSYLFLQKRSKDFLASFSSFLFPTAIGSGVSAPTTGDYVAHTPFTTLSASSLQIIGYANIFLEVAAQTAFNDPRLLNKGPYKAKILVNDVGTTKEGYAIVDSQVGNCRGRENALILKIWYIFDEGTANVQPVTMYGCSFSAPDEKNKYGEWRVDFSYDYQAGFGYGSSEAKIVNGKTYLYLEDNETHVADWVTPRVTGSSLSTTVQKGLAILDSTNGDGVVSDDGTITRYSYRGDLVGIFNNSGALTSCSNRNPSLVTTYNATYKVYDSNGMNVKKTKSITNSTPLNFSTIIDSGDYTNFDGWNFNISDTEASNHTNYWVLSNPDGVNDLSNFYAIADGTALTGTDGQTYFVRPDYVIKQLVSAAGQCGNLSAPTFDISGFDPYQDHGINSVLPTATVHRTTVDAPDAPLKVEYGVVL